MQYRAPYPHSHRRQSPYPHLQYSTMPASRQRYLHLQYQALIPVALTSAALNLLYCTK